jgi:hypothetical protein
MSEDAAKSSVESAIAGLVSVRKAAAMCMRVLAEHGAPFRAKS